jgi:hypothetical protein
MSLKTKIGTMGAAAIIAAGALPGFALASSHREAPLIAKDPSADITDLYAFVSPDAPDTVTLIANYFPFEEPAGGPNFYPFDPDVQYWIKVDNTGDGAADHTFTFEFETQVANPDSFLFSGYGPISSDTPSNISQTYTVSMDGTAMAEGLEVPPPNIGPRTTPDYNEYMTVHELDNDVKAFAGQRDDPFFADTASIFDLGGLRPFNEIHLLPLPAEKGEDSLAKFNVNSIALQLPKTLISKDGEDVTAPDADNAVVGIWAGASRQATSVLSATGAPELSGDWVQVSRLGNPLINEVIIPLGQKDEWNRGDPSGDAEYMDRYLNPELAAIINTVYPATADIDTSDRSDLVLILGQGVPGLNATNTGETLYDMLRLNMGVPPTEKPNRLGVPAGDLAGFPNGRRLWDDVVDIELRAVAQGYGPFLEENFGLPNKSPNNTVGDGCDANDVAFTADFPYLGTPAQGYKHGAHHTACAAMPPSDALASSSSRGASVSAIRSRIL